MQEVLRIIIDELVVNRICNTFLVTKPEIVDDTLAFSYLAIYQPLKLGDFYPSTTAELSAL